MLSNMRQGLFTIEREGIYKDVLGRDTDEERREDGLWINTATLHGLHEHISKLLQHTPHVADSCSFKHLDRFFREAMSAPINAVLEDIVNSLPSIAKQLGKEIPQVDIVD